MRDFSCFGENGVQVADASSSSCTPPFPPTTVNTTNRISQNLVTCVYQCKLHSSSSFTITVTWTKSLMGQCLSVEIDDSTHQSLCKLEIKPWLFTKRRGFRPIEVGSTSIEVFWDLSSAKFGSSPEPLESFYLAITIDQELVLVLGDMEKEVYKKMNHGANRRPPSRPAPASPMEEDHCEPATGGWTEPKDEETHRSLTENRWCPNPNPNPNPNPRTPLNSIFISKKEHIFGKKLYSTTAQFCGKGQAHDILIECDTINTNDPCLLIRIDGKPAVQVKRLRWKFRGNCTILVDGLPVEVYWDVHSWFFGKLMGNGVFLFQTCLSAEKLWGLDQSEMSWPRSSSGKDCARAQGLGFSLVLCAWKNE